MSINTTAALVDPVDGDMRTREDYMRWLMCIPVGTAVGEVEGQGPITKTFDNIPLYGTCMIGYPDGSCCNARYLADCMFGVEDLIPSEVG